MLARGRAVIGKKQGHAQSPATQRPEDASTPAGCVIAYSTSSARKLRSIPALAWEHDSRRSALTRPASAFRSDALENALPASTCPARESAAGNGAQPFVRLVTLSF